MKVWSFIHYSYQFLTTSTQISTGWIKKLNGRGRRGTVIRMISYRLIILPYLPVRQPLSDFEEEWIDIHSTESRSLEEHCTFGFSVFLNGIQSNQSIDNPSQLFLLPQWSIHSWDPPYSLRQLSSLVRYPTYPSTEIQQWCGVDDVSYSSPLPSTSLPSRMWTEHECRRLLWLPEYAISLYDWSFFFVLWRLRTTIVADSLFSYRKGEIIHLRSSIVHRNNWVKSFLTSSIPDLEQNFPDITVGIYRWSDSLISPCSLIDQRSKRSWEIQRVRRTLTWVIHCLSMIFSWLEMPFLSLYCSVRGILREWIDELGLIYPRRHLLRWGRGFGNEREIVYQGEQLDEIDVERWIQLEEISLPLLNRFHTWHSVELSSVLE